MDHRTMTTLDMILEYFPYKFDHVHRYDREIVTVLSMKYGDVMVTHNDTCPTYYIFDAKEKEFQSTHYASDLTRDVMQRALDGKVRIVFVFDDLNMCHCCFKDEAAAVFAKMKFL